MLKERINNLKEKRIQKLNSEINEIDEKIKEYQLELANLEKTRQENSLMIYKKRNPLLSFFVERFSKKYKSALLDISEAQDKSKEINEKIINLKQKIQNKREDQEIWVKNLITDSEIINELINQNPELCENPEFMVELIEENPEMIKFDKSNNDEVYTKYLNKILNELKQKNEDKYEIESIEEMQKELIEPQEVEQGMYKIPKKYLLEAARNNQIKMWYALNGKRPKELGESIQRIYDNKKDDVILLHSITNHGGYSEKKKESIFKNGLYAYQGITNVSMTLLGKPPEEIDFFKALFYLQRKGYIIASVPQKAFKQKSNIPIWASNLNSLDNKKDLQGKVVLLPEYIIASSQGNEITFNNIPLSERTKYDYKYTELSTEPVNETKRQEGR